jgi:hypothetical protein
MSCFKVRGAELSAEGGTFMATGYRNEGEAICDRFKKWKRRG